MCFNWSVWAKAGQPDALEYLVHRFGPILAPWILRDATARPSAWPTDLQSVWQVSERCRHAGREGCGLSEARDVAPPRVRQIVSDITLVSPPVDFHVSRTDPVLPKQLGQITRAE